ncbi:ParB/RepB/Spo0J family partition protein [Caulobacter vibrioides]|uniref:ParB/RepB/Spo0J family partition protein n=1 Tax=Caulobacter vibrioides TaxID=155892 RepID=UPI000BB4E941|nr:ParB/RepB/Spo0J family partition protein [Caulobacter vibrioides]ATC26475.1 ParB/RepB/Spo0J family partition protein [Caulobacter vibrioides]PLR12297.1 hypothetical protein CVUC_08675 [Caulobacter vibrioides]
MDLNLAFQNTDVLRSIDEHGPQIQAAELARITGRDKSNLHKTLGRLVDAGVLTKQEGGLRLAAGAHAVIAAREIAETGAVPQSEANPVRALEGYAFRFHRQIRIGEFNPRKQFDDEALDELAADIAERGLKTNLEVRADDPVADAEGLPTNQLIAGERRWRAIGRAIEQGRLDRDFPILVKIEDLTDNDHVVAALLENLHRVDLTPLEEAAAFDQLFSMNGWSTAKIAEKVSKTQRFVQLRLSLLKLTDDQKARLNRGDMTVKEALKALANRPEPVEATPIELLALALIWTNAYPEPAAHLSYWRKGECHGEAQDQRLIASLIERGLAETEEPTSWEPKHKLGTTYKGFLALEQHCSELTRAETEEARRGAMMSIDNAAYAFDKVVSTEAMALSQWLGKPLVNSVVVQKLIDEKNARDLASAEQTRLAAEEKNAARERAAQAEAQAQQLLVQLRAFEAEAPAMSREAFAAAFAVLLNERGYVGPFRIALRSPGKDQWGQPLPQTFVLVDGQDNMLQGAGTQFEVTRRLQAIALNYAMGSADIWSGSEIRPHQEDEAADDGPDPLNEVEFIDMVIGRFTEMHGLDAGRAQELAHKAYARVVEDVGEFGSEDGEWTRLDAQLVADGWLDDFPEAGDEEADHDQ